MRVFARRFPAFTRVEQVAVAFAREASRATLLSASDVGGMLVVAELAHEPTAPEDRGRLIGLVEFAPIPVALTELVDVEDMPTTHLADDGAPAWPFALPVLSAWTFDQPRMRVSDAFREPLSVEPVERVVELGEREADLVRVLPKTEVRIPYASLRRQSSALVRSLLSSRPTTGPKPAAWNAEVAHDPNTEAWTYLMRFGQRDVWKVGHTQDVDRRLSELNLHVPHEELGECWALVRLTCWANSFQAYEMEQKLLAGLHLYRTEGERVRCDQNEIETAWLDAARTNASGGVRADDPR